METRLVGPAHTGDSVHAVARSYYALLTSGTTGQVGQVKPENDPPLLKAIVDMPCFANLRRFLVVLGSGHSNILKNEEKHDQSCHMVAAFFEVQRSRLRQLLFCPLI
jgi:hypothetical protein